VERPVRWLCYRTYPTAKAYYKLRLRFVARRRGVPVLVYQMGKVASQTVVATLVHAGLSSPIFHIHVLSDEPMEDDERRYRANWTKDGTASHLWTSQYVKHRLETEPESRWRIVTLVRDPVARNVSMFFQVSQHWLAAEQQRARYLDDPGAFLGELRLRFLETFAGHGFPERWFDSELRHFFGVDVYQEPFSPSRGYRIYEDGRARVLLIRVEDLRRCAADAFRDYFGLEIGDRIQDVNIASEKHYADIYRRFVASVEFPVTYVTEMYGSRYARHFYTDEELAAFRRRWTSSRS
jgi:hypothetical protein